MHNFAIAVDYILYALVALTFALIFYKCATFRSRGTLSATTPAEVDEAIEGLEGGMALLAVVASVAPFIGLAGTVMHIMEALSQMSSATIDIRIISGPIATAMNSTLIGLCSAVPAMVAYNLMQRHIQVTHNRMLRTVGKGA